MSAIVALAAALRFYNLSGRSPWLDEIFQARWAHLNTFQEAIAQSNIGVNQMPLAYIVSWLLRPWGDGEFILRVPSVLEGTLAVWGVVIYPSRVQSALLNQSGAETTDFVDVTGHIHVVRASDSSLSAIEQARALLRREAQVQPQAGAL